MFNENDRVQAAVRGTAEALKKLKETIEWMELPESMAGFPGLLCLRAGQMENPEGLQTAAVKSDNANIAEVFYFLNTLKKEVPETEMAVTAEVKSSVSGRVRFFSWHSPAGQEGLLGDGKEEFSDCFARNGRPKATLALTDDTGTPRRLEYLVENEDLFNWMDVQDPAAWWQEKKGRAAFRLSLDGELCQIWNPALSDGILMESVKALEEPFDGDYSVKSFRENPKAVQFAEGVLGLFVPDLKTECREGIPHFVNGRGDEFFFGGMLDCEAIEPVPDWAFPEESGWLDFPALLKGYEAYFC